MAHPPPIRFLPLLLASAVALPAQIGGFAKSIQAKKAVSELKRVFTKEHGFSLNLPDGWTLGGIEGDYLLSARHTDGGTLVVAQEVAMEQLDANGYADSLKKQIGTQTPDYEIVSVKETTIAGTSGAKIHARGTFSGVKVDQLMAVVPGKNLSYIAIYSCKSEDVAQTMPKFDASLTGIAVDEDRIADTKTKISIVPPRGWSAVDVGEQINLAAAIPKSDGFRTNFTLVLDRPIETTEPEEFEKLLTEELKPSFPDWKCNERGKATISNVPALWFAGEGTTQNVKVGQLLLVVPGKKSSIVLTFSDAAKTFATNRPSFERCAASLRLPGTDGAPTQEDPKVAPKPDPDTEPRTEPKTEPKPLPRPEPKPQPKPERETISDSQNRITMPVPEGWERFEMGRNELFAIRTTAVEGKFRTNLNVMPEAKLKKLDIGAYAKTLHDALLPHFKDHTTLSTSQIEIAGRSCGRIDSKFSIQGLNVRQVCWVIPDPKASFAITFSSSAESFEADVAAIEQSVAAISLDGDNKPKRK